MPVYEFDLVTPLTDTQRDALAAGVTDIHSKKFGTPRLFVNVAFHDYTSTPYYVAGKRRLINKLVANVRTGASRTPEMWDALCSELNALWGDVVGGKGGMKSLEGTEKEMRAIFVVGGIIAGSEAGFSVPKAGEDGEWFKQNLKAFQAKAQAGDVEFREMLEEMGVENGANGNGNGVNGH